MSLKNKILTATALGLFLSLPLSSAQADSGTITFSNSYVGQFGGSGSGNGDFDRPRGIVVHNGEVFVLDSRNNRVQIFDANGNYLNKFSSQSGGGVFGFDMNHNNGRVYISERNSDQYHELLFNGIPVQTVDSIGLDGPIGITVAPNGNILIADEGNNRVRILDSTGSPLSDIIISSPRGVAVNPVDNNIYISNGSADRIQVYNSSGAFQYSFGSSGTGDSQFTDIEDIFISSTGLVYVGGAGADRVQVFDPDGTFLYSFGSSGTFNGQFSDPEYVDSDGNGRLYIAEDGGDRVQIIDVSTEEVFTSAPSGGDESAISELAHLSLEGSGDYVFSDDFTGYDDLDVDASGGSWTLSGTSSFDGDITVTNGTLINNGTLTADTTTISAGDTYGGTGTLNSDLTIDGILAPGNSIGTTNVTGDVTFNGGSDFDVELDLSDTDLLDVDGNVTINGGDVNVTAQSSSSYGANETRTIIDASGTVTGTFDSVTDNLAFLDITLDYTASSVLLQLVNNNASIDRFAQTPNQKSAVSGIDALFASGNSDASTIQTALTGLSNSGARQAIDSLTGEEHATLDFARAAADSGFDNAIGERIFEASQGLGANIGGDSAEFVGFNLHQDNPYTQQRHQRHGQYDWGFNLNQVGLGTPNSAKVANVWGKGFASFGSTDSDDFASGYKHRTFGTVAGIDKPVSFGKDDKTWIVGVVGGYGHSVVDYSNSSDKAQVDFYRLGTYTRGNVIDDKTFLTLQGGYTQSRHQVSRFVTVGAIQRLASSNFTSHQISLAGRLGRNYLVGDGWTMTPFASLRYALYHQEGYSESGAGSANLAIKDLYRHSIKPGLGVTLRNTQDWNEDYNLSPYFTVHAQREAGDNQATLTTAFEANPGTQFTSQSLKTDRASLEGTIGLKWLAIDPQKPSYDISYTGMNNAQTENHTATVKLNWAW